MTGRWRSCGAATMLFVGAVFGLVAQPTGAKSADPATTPDSAVVAPDYPPEAPPQRGPGMRRGSGGNAPGEQRPPVFKPLSDLEFTQAVQFMRESMPNTLRVWEMLPQGMRERRFFPPRLHASFRIMFESQERGDTATADLLARQLRLRDEFLGEIVQRRARGEERSQIREALTEKTREIIQASLDQRELRLAEMEKRLAAERERLDRDRANPDTLIDTQLQSLLEDSQRYMRVLNRLSPATGPTERPTTQPR